MFIYLTSKRFPATTADHIYIRALAHAFAKRLRERFKLVIAGKPSDDLQGVPVISVAVPSHLRSFFYFLWFPLFAISLPRSEPNVIFCNDFNLLSIAVFWRTFFPRRYRICSDWHLLSETWKDKYVISRSDYLITTSRRLKQAICDVDANAESRTEVVYGGVDLSQFAEKLPSRTALGLPEKRHLIGYVGLFKTMGQDKGITTMIKSLHDLQVDFTMVFVGGSDEEIKEYQSIADKEGVSDRCVFIARQPPERVPVFERSMDILVIPYPNDKHFREYGFPMKTYEYLAAERPIVYSDLSILAEVLGGIGKKFTPDDSKSLAEAVRSSMKNQPKHQNLVLYTWERKAQAILAFLSLGTHIVSVEKTA